MSNKKIEKGELFLLGFFALFVAVFLFDIRNLPLEGKMLSYLAAPFIVVTMLLSIRGAWKAAQENARVKGEGEEEREAAGDLPQSSWRFLMTIFAGLFLFGSIYLIGFYLGSGVTLLLWFTLCKRLDKATAALIIGLPLGLYVTFETFLEMELPRGAIFAWLDF